MLSELRLVKDAWEIGQLRAAIDATTRGFCDVARLILASGDLTERHVEGAFAARSRADGNGGGYHPIAAGGAHATTLHWNRNDGPLRAGDLLLLDAGVEVDSLYTADVTRTFPVSGRYAGLQRQVYEYVLAAQEAGLAQLRPGADFKAYHRACARVLAEGLADLGVLPVSAAESLQPDCGLHRRWTLCAPGHMMGLDVHDCASAREARYLGGPLAAGQVLTVEPGLYFQANDETIPAGAARDRRPHRGRRADHRRRLRAAVRRRCPGSPTRCRPGALTPEASASGGGSARRRPGEPLLDVQDLHVRFETADGTLHAVRGASFSRRRGPDPGHRRRVRVGQERVGPGAAGPGARRGRHGAGLVRGARPAVHDRPAAAGDPRPAHQHGVPGPPDQPASPLQDRLAADRGDARARHGQPRGGQPPGRRAARHGRHPPAGRAHR